MIYKKRSAVILLAEDDPGDQELSRRAFAEGKIKKELHIVADGEQALDYLFRRKQYADPSSSPWPDLFLLDLNMPKIDGREVLQRLKDAPDLPHLTIIVLTTSKREEDIVESYDMGVHSYITKPLDFARFTDVVHALENYWFEVVLLPSGKR